MIDLLQVEQSFYEPSSDDASVLEHAIEKSKWIIRVFRFFHGGSLEDGDFTKRRRNVVV
jgi:hypothetical protein